MRAVLAHKGEAIIKDITKPASPGAHQVMVRIMAASLNRADLMMLGGAAHGGWGGEKETPLGLEWAGEVVEVGPNVTKWRVGDRVMAAGAGAFAEYVVAFEPQLYAVPEGMPYEQAAALPVGLQTMHDAIATNGMLMPGQTVLFQGASSSMGIMGMQIARYLGAEKIIGTSRSAEKCARLREFGANAAINISDADWVQQALRATDDRGVDLVIDFLAGPYINGNLQAAKVGGRIINIGRVAGESGEFNFDLHNMRRITYIGASFRMRTPLESVAVIIKAAEVLSPALATGAIRMPIDKMYRLDEISHAFKRMADSEGFGKIVVSLV